MVSFESEKKENTGCFQKNLSAERIEKGQIGSKTVCPT
jgi:hypothetical protein